MKQAAAAATVDFGDLHRDFPRIPVLVVHGKADRIIPQADGRKAILKRIPWATVAEVGSGPGQIPNEQFGHQWWEYFDISVWTEVLEGFLI